MYIVYCVASLLSKVKKHVKFVLPTVTCDMEKQVWMIEAQKLKVISKILWQLCLHQQQPSWYLVTRRPSSINQIMSINSNTQLWYHEPKPLEEWRPTKTFTCEARTTFSQTLIWRFRPHHTHQTHVTHATHHTHQTHHTHRWKAAWHARRSRERIARQLSLRSVAKNQKKFARKHW